jgi:lysyl-tRNA synthetase class 2
MTTPAEPAAASPAGDNEYRAARAAKAARIRARGQDPFGGGAPFAPTHTVAQARALAPAVSTPATPEQLAQRSAPVALAGRIGNLRPGGKLIFATLFDRSRGDLFLEQRLAGVADLDGAEAAKARGIQLFLEVGALGPAGWELVQDLDLADWVGVEGTVGRSKRGEISVFVTAIRLLGKALLPPPHQVGADRRGLSPETRSRQRYLDLLDSDASLATFLLRSRLIAELRAFFLARGFLEVETPVMQPIPGGATARPFVTHHNALDLDLYLRIAPELYLKRLLVGGLERVFEIARNFRNEGISPRHNPEFTMVEWYQAYADHHAMMALSEELFRQLANRVLGTTVLRFGDFPPVDLAKPFRRIAYREALKLFGGIDYADHAAVAAKARELRLDPADFPSHDRLANAVWEAVVEPHLVEPTFITDQPAWLTPLCKTYPGDPETTMRFELFIARMEVGNAYTELNDPDVQRERFRAQAAEAAAAQDDEAGIVQGLVDEDYCTALDHGLPACGGQGLGIDRLVMLFTGSVNIRDVILFPTMRPVAAGGAGAT